MKSLRSHGCEGWTARTRCDRQLRTRFSRSAWQEPKARSIGSRVCGFRLFSELGSVLDHVYSVASSKSSSSSFPFASLALAFPFPLPFALTFAFALLLRLLLSFHWRLLHFHFSAINLLPGHNLWPRNPSLPCKPSIACSISSALEKDTSALRGAPLTHLRLNVTLKEHTSYGEIER